MSDYERIASAIRFLCEHATRQPDLNTVAAHLHMSPYHFQRLFCRWAGVTPKRFLQVLTVERAKLLLEQSCSVLDVAHTLGLSSGSRLYDHFVQLEAVTPGEYRAAGSGLNIGYGVHDTPFGQAVVAITPRGICYFSFLQEEPVETHLSRLEKKWPRARVQPEHQATLAIIRKLFGKVKKPDRSINQMPALP